MLSILIAIFSSGAVTAIITTLINRLLNRRNNKASLEGQELINVQTLIDISNQTIQELCLARQEISQLSEKVMKLTETNAKLECELQRLRKEFKKQH
jgi:predicted RNase H-like nuclease (RuvC/YqgF family)